jgi:hypothetical protein
MLAFPPVMVALALGVAFLLHASVVHADTDRQTRTVPLPAGRAISLEITVGQVRIEGSALADATIEVVRHAPNAEGLTRIPVEIVEEDTDVRIRVVQADGATDPALRSDVTLRLPHMATIRSVRIVEGRLALVALRGSISADIRRGSIDGRDLEGSVRLESGIGDVVLDGARLSPNGLLRLRAFNGDVRLTLAEQPTDARILALALNGTINSTIPLTTKTSWGPRWGEATLGKGEPVISIDVITGRIEIALRAK